MVPNEKLVFVDIETGGLEHTRPIMQMAAVAAHASLSDRPGEFELVDVQGFEAKVLFDEKKATPESLRKNSYDRELWLEAGLEPKAAAYGFAKFLREHATIDMLARGGGSCSVAQLVAHNAAFDGPFLHAWYQRLRIFCPASYRVMCTMQRAMWLIHERKYMTPPADYKLGTLCEYFGWPRLVRMRERRSILSWRNTRQSTLRPANASRRIAMSSWHSTTSPQKTGNTYEPPIPLSTFATIRLRHRKTKSSGSRRTCLAMMFKLAQSAQKRWRRLNGHQDIV